MQKWIGLLSGVSVILMMAESASADGPVPSIRIDLPSLSMAETVGAGVVLSLAVVLAGMWINSNPRAALGVGTLLGGLPVSLFALIFVAVCGQLIQGLVDSRSQAIGMIGLAIGGLIALGLGAVFFVAGIRLAWNQSAFVGKQLLTFCLACVLFGTAIVVASKAIQPGRRGPPPRPKRYHPPQEIDHEISLRSR